MAPNVPISESGTATLGINAVRGLRRNANTTRTTRTIEMISARSMSCTDARMVVVWSMTTSTSIAGEMAAFTRGSTSRTASTVLMMLAPGCRKMITITAGLPLT